MPSPRSVTVHALATLLALAFSGTHAAHAQSLPASLPGLPDSSRVQLAAAARDTALLLWQRRLMLELAHGAPMPDARAAPAAEPARTPASLAVTAADGLWSQMDPSLPGLFQAPAAAYDTLRRRILVFGGYESSGTTNETWALTLAPEPSWQLLRPVGALPPSRQLHAAVYDVAHDRLVIFGGLKYTPYVGLQVLGDAWALALRDTLRWEAIAVAGPQPGARYAHAALYDPVRDRMMVTGGTNAANVQLGDVWALALDGTPAWSQIMPGTIAPVPRARHAAAYHPGLDLMLVSGGDDGYNYPTFLGDFMAFHVHGLPRWEAMPIAGDSPRGIRGHTLVFESGQSRLILFGGFGPTPGSTVINQVWEVSFPSGLPRGTLMAPLGTPPPPREGHAAVYDSLRNRMIVFGGTNWVTAFNDVWALELAGPGAWVQLQPAGTPPPGLAFHSAVYDPDSQGVIIHGGWDGAQIRSEVWQLTLSDPPAWSQIVAGGPQPVARDGHVAVLDRAGRRMIVEGGNDGAVVLNDVWTLSLDGPPVWASSPLAGASLPAPRAFHAAIFDRDRRLILFGGQKWDGALLGDGWRITVTDSARHTRVWPSPVEPGPRSLHSTIYDPVGDRLVLFGGAWGGGGTGGYQMLNDVWALSLAGTSVWTPLLPAGRAPAARDGHVAVYDPAGHRMVIFGGNTGPVLLADTWALSLGDAPAWDSLAALGPLPDARFTHAGVFDPVRGRLVVLDGAEGWWTLFGDAWSLPLAGAPQWALEHAGGAGSLPRPNLPSGFYDPPRRRLVVFSDVGGLWELPLRGPHQWKPIEVAGESPLLRWGHSAIYDPVRDRMVVFGGSFATTTTTMNDTWALKLSDPPAWQELHPSGSPPSDRCGHTAIYDPVRDRMLIYGGIYEAGNVYAQPGVYALSFRDSLVWSLLETTGGPPSDRSFHSTVYDSVRDRLVVFGGAEIEPWDDTWALLLAGTPAWTLLPAGAPPRARSGHSAIYDPVRDRMVIFGGRASRFWGGGAYLNDVWALPFDGPGTWEQLAMDGDPPVPRAYHVALLDESADRMVIFGGDTDRLPFNDFWQVTWDGAPPVSVPQRAPPALQFAIERVWPNPASRDPSVAFTLPAPGRATLEVLDIAGRRVATVEVGGQAPGRRSVRLPGVARLPAGLYLVRLTQNGRCAATRMVVVR